MGDGTGCDNMTAIIVRFKPSFQTVNDVVIDPSAVAADDAVVVGSSGTSGSGSNGAASASGSNSSISATEPAKAISAADSRDGTAKRDCADAADDSPVAKKPKLDLAAASSGDAAE